MDSEAITLEISGGAVLTNSIIAAYATGADGDLKELLTNNLKITHTYSPNSQNSDIYKKQSGKQKDLLNKLGH
jgi:xylulokinase